MLTTIPYSTLVIARAESPWRSTVSQYAKGENRNASPETQWIAASVTQFIFVTTNDKARFRIL
ncbi:MAG: hypothetical protein HN548_03800 [Opitutae bacterium]|nr:hypothetical protein [Opitutae bacterium]